MALPEFPVVSDEMLYAIAAQHGIAAGSVAPMAQVGIFNAIYALGERYVLRVPRLHQRFEGTALNEAIAVPLARAAGVRTPALLVSDATRSILPVAYGIYERVEGRVLERIVADPALAAATWRELGRDMARLHAGVERSAATELLTWDDKTDPRPLPAEIARAGYFGAAEADWLTRWLDRLAPYAEAPGEARFLHGDSQASNLMVGAESLDYVAVLDWGGCEWGDVARDFAGVPLRAVPAMLEGYGESGRIDEGLRPRIVWRHLQIALHQLRGRPVPDYSWGERPIGMLLEVLRFFGEQRDEAWRACGP